MPELPEVEVLRRHVDEELVGASTLCGHTPYVTGTMRIDAVERVGKALGLRGEGGIYIVFRLGLAGDIFILPTDAEFRWVARHSIPFDNGKTLYFVDPRGIGKVSVEDAMPVMGPDVMQEGNYVEKLCRSFAGSTATVKAALMDQSIIAGVGNAYAAEVLWDAGINPFTYACTLSRVQIGVLVYKLRRIMQNAITEQFKLSALEYYKAGGWRASEYQMDVYGREGCPCVRCGTLIKREKQHGRSTYFCPHCQKVGDT